MPSEFSTDDRGVSQLIGALLIFSILIVAFSTYQAVGVPAQNAKVEYDHYRSVRSDLNELHANIVTSATRGITSKSAIKLGTSYPNRLIAMNPPPPTGRLVTGTPQNVTFENVQAVATEASNTREYWQGASKTFENVTNPIVYFPDYNEIDVQPLLTNGMTYSVVGDDGLAPLTEQSLLIGYSLRMIFVGGNLSTGSGIQSVVMNPQSTASRTVTVTG